MLAAVLAGFVLSPVAPWLHRVSKGATGWIVSLLPAALFIYFARFIGTVAGGESIAVSYPWVPSLNIALSFYLDGLSLLFALLITGVGSLVMIYSGGYLGKNEQLGRFFTFMLIFMAAMLGLVLADNALTMFVFWELTTISSFLLIGFEHEKAEARSAALQALIITGAGGLALLGGLVLLSNAGGSTELSGLLERGDMVRESALYLPALVLILFGAFTKSAQVPFHSWLPSAMAAPTPTSAYLHSVTMVKVGIYLLARLSPVLGGTDAWRFTIVGFGATTMVVGAIIAWREDDIKRILAYTTVSALGMLTMAIGFNSELGAEALIVFLLGHGLYKGALFLVAGIIDHETGTRKVSELGGLRNAMPITAAAAAVAALSMASIPPLFGFIGKEALYEAVLESDIISLVLIGLAIFANVFYIAAAGVVGLRPFLGKPTKTPKNPHEAPLSMWLGPVVLAGLGLLFGLVPSLADPLVEPAVSAVVGETVDMHLKLFHGFNLVLLLSVLTLAGGVAVYLQRDRLAHAANRIDDNVVRGWGAARLYNLTIASVVQAARIQTAWLQHGRLRYYMSTIVFTITAVVGGTLIVQNGFAWGALPQEVRFYEVALCGIILAGAIVAITADSRLKAIAALGVVGYGVSLLFVFFSAPDLAMTQFAIETLTVILFVLALYKLPFFTTESSRAGRARDFAIALAAGSLITTLLLIATRVQLDSSISEFFIQQSKPEAHGSNIVNVILVDFRGMDTLGEITVLALAGIGVVALLKLKLGKKED